MMAKKERKEALPPFNILVQSQLRVEDGKWIPTKHRLVTDLLSNG